MSKIIRNIKKYRLSAELNYHEYMLTFCKEGYEQARIDGSERDCRYWDKRYAKHLKKRDNIVRILNYPWYKD